MCRAREACVFTLVFLVFVAIMDKEKLSLLVLEKKQELETIEIKLDNLLKLSKRVVNNATGLQVIDYVKRHPELPKLLTRNLDLKQVGYVKIVESDTLISQLFLSRLVEFIDVYAGSKRYLEGKIEELISFLSNYE